jgi:dihydroorotate dehydrogenase (fumarate)
VIGSLNGVSPGGWSDYAAAMEVAGAAAIELNVYFLPADPLGSARSVQIGYAEMLRRLKAAVNIPVAVKLAPYAGSPGEAASALDAAGADGLVLFNRFLQADIDPEQLTVSAGFGLSTPGEAALPRVWISRLRGRVRCDLAASTGVATAADVAAYLLAGADVVMTTSALLRHGPGYAAELLDGLRDWLDRKGFASVAAARGLLSAEAGRAIPARSGYLSALDQATETFG